MAIALGVAWSPAAAALPDLAHLVDFVEAPGWSLDDALPTTIRRTVVHNLDLDASLSDPAYIDDAWAERAGRVLATTDSPWFSLHLGFSCERVRFVEHMLPESPILEREELLSRIVVNVTRARMHVDRPLLLENLDYCPEGAYEHVCEPEFIAEVIDATGCELLLDLAHLKVTASWLGWEPADMLDVLPLSRLKEVHISSPRPLADGKLDDVHEALTDEDLDLLRAVLDRSTPTAVVLEYRRDPQLLRGQLTTLGRVVGRRWRGVGC